MLAPGLRTSDPDGNGLASCRVFHERARPDASLILRQLCTLQLAFAAGSIDVRRHCFALSLRSKLPCKLVLRRNDHICRTEDGVRSRGVDLNALAACLAPLQNFKPELRAFRSANPVALHVLDALRPRQ